ncbi:MAG: hypothetical protein K2J09_02150, partial [Muribaculaceae bacterium]|nr:hypothetical protein [Muribaculaceae bacterium]
PYSPPQQRSARREPEIDVSEGMVIEHLKFGRGVIAEVDRSMDDTRIVVDFESEGRKTLLLKYARFTVV